MSVTRFIDIETGDVHLAGGDGNDLVFCGVALEGENGDAPMIETRRHKITCDTCLRMIRYAKTVPAKVLGDGRV